MELTHGQVKNNNVAVVVKKLVKLVKSRMVTRSSRASTPNINNFVVVVRWWWCLLSSSYVPYVHAHTSFSFSSKKRHRSAPPPQSSPDREHIVVIFISSYALLVPFVVLAGVCAVCTCLFVLRQCSPFSPCSVTEACSATSRSVSCPVVHRRKR